MFHPNHKPKLVWNIIVIFLLVYTATVMPYRIAFIENQMFDEWFFIDLFIDVLFFIDVIVNLVSAYYDQEGQLVTSRYIIFINYLTSWMIIDILACIPFNLINTGDEPGSDNSNQLVRLMRLPRLYRLIRVAKIFSLMQGKKPHPFI